MSEYPIHNKVVISKELLEHICVGEGYKAFAYEDSLKHLTIGCGTLLKLNIESIKKKLTGKSKEQIEKAISTAERFNASRKAWLENLDINFNNLENKKLHVTPTLAIALAMEHVKEAIDIAKSFVSNFDELSEIRQLILIDMAYNLGPRLNGFKRMQKAIIDKDFDQASEEMKNSLWYRQVKSRGVRNYSNFKSNSLKSLTHALQSELKGVFELDNFIQHINTELENRKARVAARNAKKKTKKTKSDKGFKEGPNHGDKGRGASGNNSGGGNSGKKGGHGASDKGQKADKNSGRMDEYDDKGNYQGSQKLPDLNSWDD